MTQHEYKALPFDGIDTIWKAFKNTVGRLPD